MVSNAYRFQVIRLRHRIDGLREPLRVAFLSDLHYGPYIRAGSVAAWVDAALAEAPDLVVVGGDLDDYGRGSPDLAPPFEAVRMASRASSSPTTRSR